MNDFKKTTDWYAAPGSHHEVIRATYGFSCIRGNGGPHFSVTGEIYRRKTNGTLAPRSLDDRDVVSFGMLHDQILATPQLVYLVPALPFHLFSPATGPMHYEENALFRIHQLTGETTYKPPTGEDPWAMFLRHVCWGSLSADTMESAPLREALLATRDDGRRLWLRQRLPELQLRFQKEIHAIDLDAELESGLAWFREQAS